MKFNKYINSKIIEPLKSFPGKVRKNKQPESIFEKSVIKKQHIKYRTQKKIWGVIFLTPWIIGFLLFFLKPFVESFIFSFYKVSPASSGLEKHFIGLRGYAYAFTGDPDFTRTLVESTLDNLLNLPIITIFSLLMAVLLNAKFRGRAFARAVFFIPVIFNSSAIEAAMGGGENLRSVMEQSGLGLSAIFDFRTYLMQANFAGFMINTLVSAIDRIYLIISYSGVQILIFLAGIQSIPNHLYEAAKIEGCTPYESFWKITLPMVSPLIITTVVYTVINSFLRSPITSIIKGAFNDLNYGLSASMSWIYFGVMAVILTIVLGGLSKVVFYYDE